MCPPHNLSPCAVRPRWGSLESGSCHRNGLEILYAQADAHCPSALCPPGQIGGWTGQSGHMPLDPGHKPAWTSGRRYGSGDKTAAQLENGICHLVVGPSRFGLGGEGNGAVGWRKGCPAADAAGTFPAACPCTSTSAQIDVDNVTLPPPLLLRPIPRCTPSATSRAQRHGSGRGHRHRPVSVLSTAPGRHAASARPDHVLHAICYMSCHHATCHVKMVWPPSRGAGGGGGGGAVLDMRPGEAQEQDKRVAAPFSAVVSRRVVQQATQCATPRRPLLQPWLRAVPCSVSHASAVKGRWSSLVASSSCTGSGLASEAGCSCRTSWVPPPLGELCLSDGGTRARSLRASRAKCACAAGAVPSGTWQKQARRMARWCVA